MLYLNLSSIREDQPGGEKWQAMFNAYWDSYREWYLSEGHRARPGYATCRRNLKKTMPELLPVYENLVEVAGGGDLIARFLSLYNPPPFLAACSQAILTRDEPILLRNYDYSPELFEGVLLYSNWLRPVIAVSDCLWGVLDGMNDAGLAVALAFGGQQNIGTGFGIPLILRYILETCDTTHEAIDVLGRVPSHMAYNISIVDANGHYATVFVSPSGPTVISQQTVSTNYQEEVVWEYYAKATQTRERQRFLEKRVADENRKFRHLVLDFQNEPLYRNAWEKGFGTLYTAAYAPGQGRMAFYWPKHRPLRQSFDNFTEGVTNVVFRRVVSYVK